MLSSKYRFHSRGGVKYTYQKGKTIRTPKLSLVFAPNKKQRQRYAVVVSKKVLKTAVIYSRDFLKMDFEKIRTQIRELLDKARVV